MRWSFRIARIFGIDLKVHFTFLFIIVLGALQGQGMAALLNASPAAGAVLGVLAILLLFLCVTLHELGHSLVALRFGLPVREIILLPIGGIAFMGRNPNKPMHELLIAVAGPAVNVAIIAVLIPLLAMVHGLPGFWTLASPLRIIYELRSNPVALMVAILIHANAVLVLFNMIPAFPLDGGRVLRAILGFNMPFVRATRVAAGVGQVLAVVLGLWALKEGYWLGAIIAFLIFNGAGAETAAAHAATVLATRRVGDAYNKHALYLTPDNRASHVIEHLLTSYQPDFAVVYRGRLAGVVTRDDILKWLSATAGRYDQYVTEIMHENVLRVDARLALDEVMKQMEEHQQRVAGVFDGEAFLGLVSADDIAEAQVILSYMGRPVEPSGTASPVGAPWPVPR